MPREYGYSDPRDEDWETEPGFWGSFTVDNARKMAQKCGGKVFTRVLPEWEVVE